MVTSKAENLRLLQGGVAFEFGHTILVDVFSGSWPSSLLLFGRERTLVQLDNTPGVCPHPGSFP